MKLKPIEAIQFYDELKIIHELGEFIDNQPLKIDYANSQKPVLKIETLVGEMTAVEGDYIIKDNNGNFYPSSKKAFESVFKPLKQNGSKL
jgi:hypothetical protein